MIPPLTTTLLLTTLSLSIPALSSKSDDCSLLFITLEEHWVSPALNASFFANPGVITMLPSFPPNFTIDLLDVGPRRLANMTDNNIRRQVVSHASNPAALDQPSLTKSSNDQLAALISQHPTRFSGFAVLPMAFPLLAAEELERCVKELGFVGALIDNHLVNGTFYDGAAYNPFWAKAVELDVPIYIHPSLPDVSLYTDPGRPYSPSDSDFSHRAAALLGTTAWGWHQDTGLHFLRLYTAGVFHTFPKLKIILGHMGEMVPFMLERANTFLSPLHPGQLSLIGTYKQNVWITTAGFFSLNPLGTVLRNTAKDRIMYSVDYPFGSSVNGKKFMMELRDSGLVSRGEWEAIAYGNAERLLKLK